MNAAEKFFPEGIATGDAFINRSQERSHLINRVNSHQHTVLVAPRRYGKTSLVIKVADEANMPYTTVDLLASYDAQYVRDQIVSHVERLVFDLLPTLKKASEKLLNIFHSMKPEISVGAFGQRLSLQLSNKPLEDITELLLKLDETARQFNKKAVIFLDEFQQISQLKNFHAIEASIRHAVERSQNIAYVFSGSNRHLLEQMFGDSGRPLYRLCQTLTLQRMEKDVYQQHLQILAEKRWGLALTAEVLEKIFDTTELHPFYMNVLCQLLWEEAYAPTPGRVNEVWEHYVKTQRAVISHDIGKLSLNQKKVLLALAKHPHQEIQSSDFVAQIGISASSSQQAVSILCKLDLVYKDDAGYFRVLDPAMSYSLAYLL